MENENLNKSIKAQSEMVVSADTYSEYFTQTDAGLNIEANNIEANCITSRNNKFSMDSEGNFTCNSITTVESINQNANIDFNAIYPIGSIYINIGETNPETFFGGTWERIEDKFLLSAGSTYGLGTTGGEATHILTTPEMPRHAHELYVYDSGWTNTVPSTLDTARYGAWTKTGVRSTGYPVRHEGGNQAHNNMPPYLVVNVWKRTA